MAEQMAGFARARRAGAWFSASPRVQRFAAIHVAVLLTGALSVVAIHQQPNPVEERLTLAAAAAPVQVPVAVAPEPPRQAAVGAAARPAAKKRHSPVAVPASVGWTELSARIRGCESHGSPGATADYKARNPHSTASGAYQITDSTWGGRYGVSHAADATPAEQDAAAADLYRRHGTADWVASSGCWHLR